MGEHARGPIYSSHADDPDRRDAIDAFVVGLAERIDALQDADVRGELARLAGLAQALAADARGAGFDDFGRCALEVAGAGLDGVHEKAHAGLVELTDMATRIRLGHRGAA